MVGMPNVSATNEAAVEVQLEAHRRELTGYCYRMLGSPFEAEDAVQGNVPARLAKHRPLRRSFGAPLWLYRIATNVCLDMLEGGSAALGRWTSGPERAGHRQSQRASRVHVGRADPQRSRPPGRRSGRGLGVPRDDPTRARRRAPAPAAEAARRADPLQRSCAGRRPRSPSFSRRASRRSTAPQRARATLSASDVDATTASPTVDEADAELLARYVQAFEQYDMEALTQLIHEDATQSMPPYDLWLRGRDDMFRWWVGPGAGCRGSA